MNKLCTYSILFYFFLLFISVRAQTDYTPIIETANGPLFGSRKFYNGGQYEEYLGIPFAAPPVGPLRWQKPQPVKPWSEPLNATEYSPHCTQFMALAYPLVGYSARNGEDCLYMNIYVPGTVQSNSDKKLPVMVWMYGGAYFFGTGEQYPSHALALHGELIVVNFNYRLSTLGFLSTADSEAPGNYGLWDQNAALLWVRENIDVFGGDITRVTIFGQSAGGASVSHSIISPYNEGLFQNGIAISGASTAVFAVAYNPLRTAVLLGDLLNCDAHNSQELVTCLREEDPHKLDFWGIVMTIAESGEMVNLLPVVDGDYVPVHPAESFKAGIGKDINYITGSAYNDAAGFIILNLLGAPHPGDDAGVARNNASIWEFARLILGGGIDNVDEVFNAVIDMYPDIYSPDLETRTQALCKAVTEWWFGSPTNWEARQHFESQGDGKTFQYQFKHRQSFLIGYPEWLISSHIDDLYSVFGEPFQEYYREKYLEHDFSPADLEVSRRLMDYYSNFAHTGNPNEGPFQPDILWEEYTTAAQNFLELSENFRMSSFYDDNVVDRYRFWTEVFPQLVHLKPPTSFPPFSRKPSQTWDSSTKPGPSFTEREIDTAIAKLKSRVRTLIPSVEAQETILKKIDEFVEERNRNPAYDKKFISTHQQLQNSGPKSKN